MPGVVGVEHIASGVGSNPGEAAAVVGLKSLHSTASTYRSLLASPALMIEAC